MSEKNLAAQKLQSIPHAFLAYVQFINWFPRVRGDVTDKIPCNPYGHEIDAHNPANWVSAEVACASAFEVGFVFTKDDPFWFIDLDGALDPATSQWSPLANWVGQQVPGAAFEISHSGTGAHFFGTGSHILDPMHRCKRIGLGFEIYTWGRFVALTGKGMAGDAATDHGRALPPMLEALQLGGLREDVDDELIDDIPPDPAYTGPDDDAALVKMMLASVGGVKAMFQAKCHVKDLWEANAEALAKHFPPKAAGKAYDASDADAALMSHLSFWTGRDVGRMERLFKQSGLWREKYEARPSLLRRIIRLGARNKKVYDKPRAPVVPLHGIKAPGVGEAAAVAIEEITTGQFTALEQIELFKGCYYLEDRHAVMLPDGRIVGPMQFNAIYGGHEFQMQPNWAKPTRKAFDAFTENRMQKFGRARGACFRPSLPPGTLVKGYVNSWFPPEIDAVPGDVMPFIRHVERLLPDERDRRILLTYMCAVAQFPGHKFQWAPVVQGAEGNGKSLLIRALTEAVGFEYAHLPKAAELDEKFNAWMERCIFVGVEEIYIQDRRKTLEILKDAVTNDRIEIRGMQKEKRMADNFTNWFFCTNHRDAVPVNRDQRRYAIFYTAQQTNDDIVRDGMGEATGYFPVLYDWFKGGGKSHVAHWLRTTDISESEFNPVTVCQRAPKTSSSEDAIKESQGNIESEIIAAADDNQQGFRNDWLSSCALDNLMQTAGLPKVSNKKKSDIIKSLGYVKIGRCGKVIVQHPENGQPWIYRRNGKGGDSNEFLIDQGYHDALRASS